MSLNADTNILLRVILEDDPAQAATARSALRSAERVIITAASLCELVWVMGRLYQKPSAQIAAAIRLLVESDSVLVDHEMVDAGLAMLEHGGDFADGAIAFEGRRHSAVFTSFDRKAVRLLVQQGHEAHLLT